ncbi:Cytochrome c-type biogenesis protein CcmE, heme chaperone [hydrothermal vent metagenome]|uniref:Cytochrome c-type biogenesis protein CcmE, heme chaperone n=1 Tax=hydrothermal vent metagenome TaxID=652676 RepID=A0A3B1BQQ9_9ZZZZ
MKPRHKRFVFAVISVIAVGVAAKLILQSISEGSSYFYSPKQVLAGEAPTDQVFRVGGLVKEGSLQRIGKTLTVEFIITDDVSAEVTTRYTGILPDLFREGQGVVAKGRLGENTIFEAEEVLAKHDEKYLAPEVKDALEEARNEAIRAQQEAAQ